MAIKQKAIVKSKIVKKPGIPMLDLKIQYKNLKHEIEKTLKEIFKSGHFILGPYVAALEKEVAEYHHAGYAVSLASGTDALHLSLRALGIKEGDEVITTPFTFIAAAEAIAYVGAVPVFADIDRQTLNIDPKKIEDKITKRTRAVIPVHLFGLPAEMKEIIRIARKHNLKVIEDCAQAFGAKYKGAYVGSIGDTGCFSFYPSKNLGAYGDGGIMITDSSVIFEKVKLLRNHGTSAPYSHSFIGYNSRLDEIQAAILRIKLKNVNMYNQKRLKLAQIYTSIISKGADGVMCPPETKDSTHVYHQYTIRYAHRDALKKILNDNSISSVVYYPIPLHLQDAFKYLGYKEGDLPESEAAAREVLSLPIYPELETAKAKFVAETVVKAVGK
jgi:dTDP-4-amino-4,6-dideoxygalactose transaminase